MLFRCEAPEISNVLQIFTRLSISTLCLNLSFKLSLSTLDSDTIVSSQ